MELVGLCLCQYNNHTTSSRDYASNRYSIIHSIQVRSILQFNSMALSVPTTTLLLSLPLLLLPLLLLLLRQLRTQHRYQSKTKLKLPPGPPRLPFIGNLHEMSLLAHRDFRRLAGLNGPLIHLRFGRAPVVVVSSPSVAQQVLKTQDLAFCSRPPLTTFKKYSYDGCDVAASPYGDSWRNLRRIFVNELLSSNNLPLFKSAREDETRIMTDYIATRPDPDSAVSLSELAVHLSSSIISRVAFGYKSGGEYGERSRFRRIFQEGNHLVASFFAADHWPGFGWVDTLLGLNGRLERNAEELDAFYEEVIARHLDVGRRKGEGCEEDVVDVMIRLWKDGNSDLTLEHIKGALMNIIVAGTDTSAATIVWAMAELVRHPAAMGKAQEELRNLMGTKGKVEESDLPRLQYLKSVVKETLRLHAPLPMLLPRETTRDCEINGYDIPARTRVFVNAWAIGRDGNSWENPEEFLPERFVGSPIDHKGRDFQFIPFGSGRRICPGMNFAIATVELALANLLYAFNWELPSGTRKEDIGTDEAPGLILHKKSELFLVARNNNW